MTKQVIERVWDAPIELVWELWTTADGIASWFGPRGFTVVVDEIDLRPGGVFRYTMRATDPQMKAMMAERGRPEAFTDSATFTDVEPPHRLAYKSPMGPETLFTSVEFSVVPGGVKMVLVIDATKPGMTEGAAGGWVSSLARFGDALASRSG